MNRSLYLMALVLVVALAGIGLTQLPAPAPGVQPEPNSPPMALLGSVTSGLYQVQQPGIDEVVFTVPSDRSIILRNLWNNDPTSTTLMRVRVKRAGLGTVEELTTLVLVHNNSGDTEFDHTQWAVFGFRLGPGDQLIVNQSGGGGIWLGWAGIFAAP